MHMKNNLYNAPAELVLGTKINDRIPKTDQIRQRTEVESILLRFQEQPGVILADEVGMGKTFVALAIAYSITVNARLGPVVVMVPANLIDKWKQDLSTFCELYLENCRLVHRNDINQHNESENDIVRYDSARHSVEFMRLLDDPADERCHLIFLAQGAMSRSQTDKWIRLALIAETLRRHGRGRAKQLINVKQQIHRFLAELLWAIGEERAHNWGDYLWKSLLKAAPFKWKEIYNSEMRDEWRKLDDDPIPESVVSALPRIDLSRIADALKHMPLRARGGQQRVSERLGEVRSALKEVEGDLWKELLVEAKWRSPLLVMDEAHHLKNPDTSLARQFKSPNCERDLRIGDGAMAGAFDRMLFLTATPFQLGHHELVRVLERFGDVRWDHSQFGTREMFVERLRILREHLDASQRAAIHFQRCWGRLRPDNYMENVEVWWERLINSDRSNLPRDQRSAIEAFEATCYRQKAAEEVLRPWIVRHNKGKFWSDTQIERRCRINGSKIVDQDGTTGLTVPGKQLLPFFLAARSAVDPGKDLLGEALCSSYEAFRNTREKRTTDRDEVDDNSMDVNLTHSSWYLQEFDTTIAKYTGNIHPKVQATVQKAVDLWEVGEKVLIFAFYRQTCAALRIHISNEIKTRTKKLAQHRFAALNESSQYSDVVQLLRPIQDRYFDDPKTAGRKALDRALNSILDGRRDDLLTSDINETHIIDAMRRFLRVPTTLVRCFPFEEYEDKAPKIVVDRLLDMKDASKVTWRDKFAHFVDFLLKYCSASESKDYLDATTEIRTGGIRVEGEQEAGGKDSVVTLPNVQVATGSTRRDTRSRLMRAFNTPFFPDILVCSQVMGEGVDLHRYCHHVIHHDLAWNPSSIEQRTGRVDRLGCKAESRVSISVYLPYLAGAADERQFRVMTEREQWFRVVMGQDEVARLITPETSDTISLPITIADKLSFNLAIGH